MTVNQAWKGRRFRSDLYTVFRTKLLLLLRRLKPRMPKKSIRLFAHYKWGVSNIRTDVDNPTKPFQDVLFDHSGLKDEHVHFLILEKHKTPKGKEYIEFVVHDIEDLVPYLEKVLQQIKEEHTC